MPFWQPWQLYLAAIQNFPTPTGIVTLLDLGVYFTAFYFVGRKEGAIVSGVGAFSIWFQAILSGCSLASSFTRTKADSLASRAKLVYLGLLLATVVMVGGYALASALFLGNGWGLLSPGYSRITSLRILSGMAFRLCGLLCIPKERLIHGSGACMKDKEISVDVWKKAVSTRDRFESSGCQWS